MRNLDLKLIARVKRLAVLAMVSDDYLLETLVFKGGSAIEMIYQVTDRSSLDLDFSMVDTLSEEEEIDLGKRIENSLISTFDEEGLIAHDIVFKKKPKKVSEEVKGFWGGYAVEFKVIDKDSLDKLKKKDRDTIVRSSLPIGAKGSTKFKIDISSYEYCKPNAEHEFEGYTIYVYTPEMIVFEKLRAVCQQIPDYRDIVKTHTSNARGRDFYDIELLMEEFNIDPSTEENIELLKNIFAIKKVPLDYIKRIVDYRDLHKENFDASLTATVGADADLQEFDYYFDYVLDKFADIDF